MGGDGRGRGNVVSRFIGATFRAAAPPLIIRPRRSDCFALNWHGVLKQLDARGVIAISQTTDYRDSINTRALNAPPRRYFAK